MLKTKRMTRQKKVIMNILRSTRSHPTADWVYEQARQEIPDISLGTVYRNLNQLKEDGQIMELCYGSSYRRYDGNPENHYHFHCQKCGKVYDVEMPLQTILDEKVKEIEGHQVIKHRLEFYGICSDCLQGED